MIKNSNGLYINSNEYREFFDTSNIVASEFIKYILQDTKNILINQYEFHLNQFYY